MTTLADELSEGKDLYDVNTIQGCLNRAGKISATRPASERFGLFPIKDEEGYYFYKVQTAGIWVADELDFSKDKKDYEKLPNNLKNILDLVMAFFASADGIIINNLVFYFLTETTTLEEKSMYLTQIFQEMIHSETYNLSLATMVPDDDKRNMLFKAVDEMPAIRNKALWMQKYTTAPIDIQYRRIAYCLSEGLFFISSFLFIFYFKTKAILQNFIEVNLFIARDESTHREMGVMLYKRGNKLPDEHVQKLVKEAVNLEIDFVNTVLPEKIDELEPEAVKNYVKFLGDHLLISLGHPAIWNINPESITSWIHDINREQKTNFYEGRVTSYLNGNLSKTLDWRKRIKGSYDEKEIAYSDPSSVNF